MAKVRPIPLFMSSPTDFFRRHRLSHSDPKEICSWEGCGKAFYRNDLLRRHELRQ
jgi:uncharacterized Zn-finger protein